MHIGKENIEFKWLCYDESTFVNLHIAWSDTSTVYSHKLLYQIHIAWSDTSTVYSHKLFYQIHIAWSDTRY